MAIQFIFRESEGYKKVDNQICGISSIHRTVSKADGGSERKELTARTSNVTRAKGYMTGIKKTKTKTIVLPKRRIGSYIRAINPLKG